MSVQNMNATNTNPPINESVFSGRESHDANFAPEQPGFSKAFTEINSLVISECIIEKIFLRMQ